MNLIQLDDDICNVLPSGYNETSACRNPAFPEDKVTWRMLLTHRSSLTEETIGYVIDQNENDVIASYGPTGGWSKETPAAGNPTCPLTDVTGYFRDVMIDKPSETLVGRDGLILLSTGEPINWYQHIQESLDGGVWSTTNRPGSMMAYSNFAFGYIAALVEHTVGQSFDTFFQENIVQPLGMDHTSWFRETLPNNTVSAVPVYAREDGTWEDIGHYCYIDYTSGQLYSTANDMVKWGEAMLQRGVPTLWSEATSNQTFGCQEKDVNGNLLEKERCQIALSWFLAGYSDKPDFLLADDNATEDDEYYYADYYEDNPEEEVLQDDSEIVDDYYEENDNGPMRHFLRRILTSRRAQDDNNSNGLPFADLDWTDAILHEGGEEGISTIMMVLPKAGTYVVVLLNTSEMDEDAINEMLLTISREASKAVMLDDEEDGEDFVLSSGMEADNTKDNSTRL